MKKLLSLILAFVLTAALCACGGAEEESTPFQVGFGRVDITPTTLGLPLAGYGQTDKRLHTTVYDNIYVSCVAITGTNNETLLLMSIDLINSGYHESVRKQISQTLGVPYENIMISATHTHSAPDPKSNLTDSYMGSVYIKILQAAQAAMEDRSPATISIGRTETEGINFIRHYIMNDGTYAGANFGSWSSGIKGYAEENDGELQIIRFTREGEGKKDIIMVNGQGHPLVTSGVVSPYLSADVVGAARTQVEHQAKADFIFFLGASGNVNMGTRLPNPSNPEDHQEFGRYMCEYIVDALDTLEPIDGGEVHTLQQTYMGDVNREMEDRLVDALHVQSYYNDTDRDTGNKLAWEMGFSSVYHAIGIVTRSSIMTDTLPIDLSVYSFGDISFTSAPYEMFAKHGMQIKEGSPYAMTFVATCANGGVGYLPTEFAFEFGCYESHSSRFTKDTGTKCAETFLEMLETMKAGE